MQDIISRHLRICAVFLGYDFFQESIFSVFFNVAIKRGFAVLLAVKKVHVNGRFLRLINSGLTLFRIIVRKWTKKTLVKLPQMKYNPLQMK